MRIIHRLPPLFGNGNQIILDWSDAGVGLFSLFKFWESECLEWC